MCKPHMFANLRGTNILVNHVIQLTGNIFKLNCHIKETNVLTEFNENWAKIVTCRVFTCFHYIHIEKNGPPTGCHVFASIWTIFKLVQDINKTNVLTNSHDDWAKIVTSIVFTSHVIQLTGTIFELNSHIKETNLLTKFHENSAKNVTSRVEKCPAHWRPYINKTNVLTNFHDNWAKVVTSRVFTRKTSPPTGMFTCFHYIHIEKNALPTGRHVFSPIWTIFELVRDINKTDVLINFHDNWAKIVTSISVNEVKCPAPWRPYIIRTNLLTKFNGDQAINVASRFNTQDNEEQILKHTES
ncbi:hypothetical protein DPMN_003346 [Dreissena polymorpha]|uniref:Uncharacterized protein n=1 Tax=Dreissena polymorpha TaxID=45954 RepID=A0A9D4MN20_DREPO|nr:hypothetical protein DPMN_003346 [Dreissena polymorpha]